ncbi:peptidoglycan DD-metalloendopeptidase family protein [Ichthyenterobacterium magnum]|uniref:Putative secreted protein (Por secretion system target) n=1 Tax=Ichthyenterobacterium magnum TaxID=1230530 RepID=A0A420DXI5_9FLAO|nr:peptidoglycan DD-metalloendopeptidase family protein [Ichthyenterobacterium magnum]RKE98891.1 putative secreted protein (Por secretion system target) [Ichthyenterobacterium magnum]
MLSKITLFFFTFLFINFGNAQIFNEPSGGGEYVFNESQKPCLTPAQRLEVKKLLKKNTLLLRSQNKLTSNVEYRGNHPLFIWPIQKAGGVTFNHVWSISGYVDHNINPNALLDYNCGATTYDTPTYNHQGLDIYTWPFTWKLMDDDSVEIIAAATGQIIAKGDGQFDRSCNFNNNPWNAVYVQHSDGSVAWYGHMKNGSLTSKNVGDIVTQGEYLGIVGSSGNSTGPHLHFEVYTDDNYTQLVDPYSGSCNNMNGDSWWQNQKPYKNPGINAVLTHSQAPNIFPACPTTETPYINNDFETSDTIYFAIYLRDQTAGDIINLEIIRPDGSSLFGVWDVIVGPMNTASSWYYYWYYSGYFDMEGEWKWRATFGGETITHNFNVGTLSLDENDFSATSIYPNPFKDIINIKTSSKVINVEIIDILGKKIRDITNDTEGISTLNLENLSNGVYFLSLKNDLNQKKTIKVLKE